MFFVFLKNFFFSLLNLVSIVILLFVFSFDVFSQINIQDKDWSPHVNLKNINFLSYFNDKLFCFAPSGFYSLDLNDNSISKNFSSLNVKNLSFTASLTADNTLILASKNGEIEVFANGEKSIIDLNSPGENIVIHSMSIFNNTLFVSSNLGLINVSLELNVIKEKYQYFGEKREKLIPKKSYVIENKLFIITDNGIYYYEHGEGNPLDFNYWKKISIESHKLIGIYSLNDSYFYYSDNSVFGKDLELVFTTSEKKLINVKTYGNNIYMLFKELQSDKIKIGVLVNNKLETLGFSENLNSINDFVEVNGHLWIAGNEYSIYNSSKNNFFIPSDNLETSAENIKSVDNGIYVFSSSNSISYNISGGEWQNYKLSNFDNISSVANYANDIYYSSYSQGLLNYSTGEIINHLSENSLLFSSSNDDVNISDIFFYNNKLWMINYGSKTPLLSYEKDNSWSYYDLKNNKVIYPIKFKFNKNYIWILLEKNMGGGIIIYNIETNQVYNLSKENGKLNTNNVNDIDVDNLGNVWVATDEGLIYYSSSDFDDDFTYTIPNDGEKFLFKNVKITSSKATYSNHVLLGTEDGLIIFDNLNNSIVYQFNSSNSPLVDDFIKSISINDKGVSYILTSGGLMSLKTASTKPTDNYSKLKIYPNPLKLKEHDRLFFESLIDNNSIKIVSLNGEKVLETKVYGGGFTWNLINTYGNKIGPGIYLVFIIDQDGAESMISKILVI